MAFTTPPNYIDSGVSYIPYGSELSLGSGPRFHDEAILFNNFEARVGAPYVVAYLVALEVKDQTTNCIIKQSISSVTTNGFKLTTLTDGDAQFTKVQWHWIAFP